MAQLVENRAISTAPRQANLLIGGQWLAGGSVAPVLNKFDLTPYAEAHLPSREQIVSCVASAKAAFRENALDNFTRGKILDEAARLIEGRAGEFIDVLRQEAGFTKSDATGEVRRSVNTFRLSAEEARKFVGEMVPLEGAEGQSGRIGFTLRVPLGVVCAITPFNAPVNTVSHKIAPAIAAGNAVILKPSLHTPISSCILAEILIEAGLPKDIISVVHGGPEVVNWLLEEEDVHFFAFTGSTAAGRAIQARAGLRRTQMELGALTHCIVCADADLDRALPKIINAGYRKAGQVCTSIQVLLVHRQIIGEVEQRLSKMVSELRYGDPGDPLTVVGPVISRDSALRIENWIEKATAAGAKVLVGGKRDGQVVSPALLTDVDACTPLGCQEVFGPVMCIAAFDSLQAAIDRVNSTPFGLATGIFTGRIADAFEAARKLEVGGVHINETSSSRVDVMPYGGTKDSGFGREGPPYAVREMSEERMITMLP